MAASSRGLAAAPPVPLDVKIGMIGTWPATARCLELRKGRIQSCCSDSGGNVAGGEMIAEEWRRSELKKCLRRVQTSAIPVTPFPSRRRSQGLSKLQSFYPRCNPKNSGPHSRDTPPERDTGIASEKEWGINLLDGNSKESGTNEDGSTWYQESGEDIGGNGYRCRWTRMGGQSKDGSSEWTETWWEKSDWTGYKELGAEKCGRNAEGDSWWETWQEVLYQDEWRKVHKYGKSTTGESWDIVVDEETYYEAEPHYGWAEVVGESSQLLSIEPRERPPGVYPTLDFGSSPPPPPPKDDLQSLPPKDDLQSPPPSVDSQPDDPQTS